MALVITDPEANRLANAIAEITGQTVEEVVLEALREAHERLVHSRAGDAADEKPRPESLLPWSNIVG